MRTVSDYTGTPIGGVPLLAVAIGASAGGPAAIQAVLSQFPRLFPVPVAICQHLTEGASAHWAERLDGACRIRVAEARQGEPFMPGRVYIAPAGRHMRIRGSAAQPHVSLEFDRSGGAHVPAIDDLMLSMVEVFGSRCLGVLLTGMGRDGAKGLLAMRRAGAVTLAEPLESAFISSMPAAAAEAGAVGEFMALDLMAGAIAERVAGRV